MPPLLWVTASPLNRVEVQISKLDSKSVYHIQIGSHCENFSKIRAQIKYLSQWHLSPLGVQLGLLRGGHSAECLIWHGQYVDIFKSQRNHIRMLLKFPLYV